MPQEATTEALTPKQEKAVTALLSAPTLVEAGKRVGVSDTTLQRWLSEQAFSNAYRDARREAVSQAIAQLQQASTEAVSTLREIMKDTEAPTASRVTAARCVLETAIKGVELEDLAARIEALEGLAGSA